MVGSIVGRINTANISMTSRCIGYLRSCADAGFHPRKSWARTLQRPCIGRTADLPNHGIGWPISSAIRSRNSVFLILVPDIGQSSTKRT